MSGQILLQIFLSSLDGRLLQGIENGAKHAIYYPSREGRTDIFLSLVLYKCTKKRTCSSFLSKIRQWICSIYKKIRLRRNWPPARYSWNEFLWSTQRTWLLFFSSPSHLLPHSMPPKNTPAPRKDTVGERIARNKAKDWLKVLYPRYMFHLLNWVKFHCNDHYLYFYHWRERFFLWSVFRIIWGLM